VTFYRMFLLAPNIEAVVDQRTQCAWATIDPAATLGVASEALGTPPHNDCDRAVAPVGTPPDATGVPAGLLWRRRLGQSCSRRLTRVGSPLGGRADVQARVHQVP